MHSFIHMADKTVHSLQPVFILIALGGWALAMVGQISAYRSRKPGSPRPISRKFIVGVLVFAGTIGGEFAISAVLKSAALDEISPKLSADIEAVTVNGAPFDKTRDLIAALRDMHTTMGHHSHPVASYRLFLRTSRGPLVLQLCRDSEDLHEYWVFYPEFYSTKSNDVAHVFTAALDGM
jgi:hypothetical protein